MNKERQYVFCEVHSNKIIEIGYDENDEKYVNKHDYQPSLALLSKNQNSKWKTLHDEPVELKTFDSIRDMREFKKSLKDSSVKIYGDIQPQYQYLSENYYGKTFDFNRLKRFYFDIEIYSKDKSFTKSGIYNAIYPISCLTIYSSKTELYYVFATKKYDKDKTILDDIDPNKIKFCYCENEEKLLINFILFFKDEQPDTLQGWYSESFDIPYTIKRCEKIVSEKDTKLLSPFGRVSINEKEINGKIQEKPYIGGVTLFDLLDLYKKYMKPKEEYSLDYISSEELGDKKLDYSEEDDLNALWENNPQKYIDYNIKDVKLLVDLDKKLQLTSIPCTIAYRIGANLIDPIGTIRAWDVYLYNKFKEKNIVIPPNVHKEKIKFPGGFVKKPIPGIYKWVMSVDVNSLYPHLQQQYNISPEMLIDSKPVQNIRYFRFTGEYDDGKQITEAIQLDKRFLQKEIKSDPNYILAANGHYFRKDKEGIIPIILKELYKERKIIKKDEIELKKELLETTKGTDRYYELEALISSKNNTQQAIKIFMNSEYGAIGNRFFRHYDLRLATAVTLGGQLTLQWTEKQLINHPLQKKYNWKVIYGDTDSLYLSFDKYVEKLKQENQNLTNSEISDILSELYDDILDDIIKEGFENLKEYMNLNENRMFMAREIIAESGLFIAKKKYVCRVWDDEGIKYKEPKLKVTGVEVVQSATPKVIKESLRKALIFFLTDQSSLINFIKSQRLKYKNYDPNQIAISKTANNIEKYLKNLKGTPIAVHAAITYLKYKKKHNLITLPNITSGEKIKYLYLIQPNPFNSHVIGFTGKWPFGEKLKQYIDFEKMFQKSFFKPIQNIGDKINFKIVLSKQKNIRDLFKKRK